MTREKIIVHRCRNKCKQNQWMLGLRDCHTKTTLHQKKDPQNEWNNKKLHFRGYVKMFYTDLNMYFTEFLFV